MSLLSLVSLTILFFTIYYVSTHQHLYFGRELFFVDAQSLITAYVLLLTYVILRGKLSIFKPFCLAIALYIASRLVIFNASHYYPVTIPDVYILLLLISAALIAAELPKRHLFSSAGFALAAVSAYLILEPFGIALLAFAVLAFMSVSTFASGFDSWLAKGIAKSRGYVILAFSAIILLNFAKPYLRGGLFDFAEWLILVALAFLVVRNVKLEPDVQTLERHTPRITARRDELAKSIDLAARKFVDEGEKAELIAIVAKTMFDAGMSEVAVARAIESLVNYRDESVPLFSFSWERKIIEGKNKRRREKVLDDVMSTLKELR